MPDIYQVQSGDLLGVIATRYNTTVSRLMKMNPGVIEHPDQIYPGQSLKVPANDEEVCFSSASAFSVVDRAECQEEYVEIIHVTGTDELVFLTQSDLSKIEAEETIVGAPIERLYRYIEADTSGVKRIAKQPNETAGLAMTPLQEHKQSVVNELEAMDVVSTEMQTMPRLTEIKRLKGNKHYTYVRSDKIANHWRRYKMTARDRDRSSGWMRKNGIDGEKLKKAVESDFGIKFKSDLWKLDPQSNLSQSLNQFHDEVSWSIWGEKEAQEKNRNETGFDASAEAQYMRFASGAAISGEFTPAKGKVHLQAKAEAQFSLAEGKASIEQVFPANDYSEIRLYYRVGGWDGERAYATLGHFQARLTITASGFAGASAMLAANVHVDSSQGVPRIKGIAAGDASQGANAEAGAFAGIRGGCELLGSLCWTDVLSREMDWKTLCKVGPKVEGAAGLGAEGYLKLGFNETTGKFFVNAHAGLVLGLGAAGSFLLEINANNVIEMLHFVYKALGDVDFHHLELFDSATYAFEWYQKIAIFALQSGKTYIEANARVIEHGIDQVEQFIRKFINDFQQGAEREQRAEKLAENVLQDIARRETSVFLHSPPEVKGPILEKLVYDYWLTPQLWDGTRTKVKAIGEILKSFQSWRDFEETMMRMNAEGTANDGVVDTNAQRVFEFIGMNRYDYLNFRRALIGETAQLYGPVRLDPFRACRDCGVA